MRAAIIPYFKYIAHYDWKVYHPQSENYLVLTNHNTNWDFFLFGLSFPRHMYFVASEHIYRLGFASKIIKFLGAPIPRKKGANGSEAVALILESLKAGNNVCMMAEGNRSFSGETGWISPRTAELAKQSGAGLITYRIHGGYFINPRWSTEKRRGKYSGEVVREYSPEMLNEMSCEELAEAIRQDLYVNAYDDQKLMPQRYRCKNPAEHLETALFTCPDCKSFSSLHSKGSRFYCDSCGLDLILNDYGYFESDKGKPEFDTILDWFNWQLEYLREYLPEESGHADFLLFSDDGIRLNEICGKASSPVDSGKMSMFTDKLRVGSTEIHLSDIEKISIVLVDTILFTANGKYYEIKSEKPYSALKYLISSRLLSGKEYV